MISIDKYAYINKLSGVHPMEKFIFALGTLLLCLYLNSIPVSIVVIITMAYLTVVKAGVNTKFYYGLIRLPFYFLFLSIIAILVGVVDCSKGVVCSINAFGIDIGITYTSLTTATNLFFKAMASVSCLYFLSLTTTLVDLISILRKFKCPELLLELISLVYKFIFVLIETAGKIYNAQWTRLGYSTLKNSFNSIGLLVSNLFIISYKKMTCLINALDARCYAGKLNVLEETYTYSKTNIFLIILFEVFIISFALLIK